MSWFGATVIETASGLKYDFRHPTAEQVTLSDIAHALSHTCRFGGHTERFYSVADHSVYVSELVEASTGSRHMALHGLMHDAHEAYLGDVPKPLKNLLGPEYELMCDAADLTIAQRFGLDAELFKDPAVKDADRIALVHEAQSFMPSRGPLTDAAERVPTLTASVGARAVFHERAAMLGIEDRVGSAP